MYEIWSLGHKPFSGISGCKVNKLLAVCIIGCITIKYIAIYTCSYISIAMLCS